MSATELEICVFRKKYLHFVCGVCVCVCGRVCVCVCVCVEGYYFVWVCVWVYLCVGVWVCVWLFLCVGVGEVCVVCLCGCACIFVCSCVLVCVWCVCLSSFNCVFIYRAQTGKWLLVLVRKFVQLCWNSSLRHISKLNTAHAQLDTPCDISDSCSEKGVLPPHYSVQNAGNTTHIIFPILWAVKCGFVIQ
jgi:hypothetical protein